jgi:hypothetical protein
MKQVNELLKHGTLPTVENPTDQEMLTEGASMETDGFEKAEEQLVEFIVALLLASQASKI